jgi:hypothetical protein
MPNKYNRKTFYVLGTAGMEKEAIAVGYTDYPTLENTPKEDLLDFGELIAKAKAKARL